MLKRAGSFLSLRVSEGTSVMRTSWPAARLASGKMLRADFDHAARGPGVGAGALQDLAQGIAVADAEHLRLAALEVGERVLFVLGRLDQDSGVRRQRRRTRRRRRRAMSPGRGCASASAPARIFSASVSASLASATCCSDLGVLELLSVLVGQDAAQQLDDVDDTLPFSGSVELVVLAGVPVCVA